MKAANEKAGKLLVIAAPSGAGKTTLVKLLVERNPELRFSISYTTRQRRRNERDGRDYFFVTVTDFHELERKGELLESALVFDNHYGTSRRQVENHLAAGHNVILEIDWQGARQVRQAMPQCVSVFILPPSRGELERRLRNRRTDSEAVSSGACVTRWQTCRIGTNSISASSTTTWRGPLPSSRRCWPAGAQSAPVRPCASGSRICWSSPPEIL